MANRPFSIRLSYPSDLRPKVHGGGAELAVMVAGNWTVTVFECPLGHANVTSFVERKSRYTVLIKNPSRHSLPDHGQNHQSSFSIAGICASKLHV